MIVRNSCPTGRGVSLIDMDTTGGHPVYCTMVWKSALATGVLSRKRVWSMKGSYLLILRLDAEVRQLPIGRLGCFDFAAGYYLYVGSSFGPGGLAARLAHHAQPRKRRPHWHLDYLRSHTRLCEAWTVSGPPRLECRWCSALAGLPEVSIPARGFGASDTHCRAHLFYTATQPHPCFIANLLLNTLPTDTTCCQALTIEIYLFDESE